MLQSDLITLLIDRPCKYIASNFSKWMSRNVYNVNRIMEFYNQPFPCSWRVQIPDSYFYVICKHNVIYPSYSKDVPEMVLKQFASTEVQHLYHPKRALNSVLHKIQHVVQWFFSRHCHLLNLPQKVIILDISFSPV